MGAMFVDGELLLFTPIDPAFLVAPLLRAVFPVVGRNATLSVQTKSDTSCIGR